MVAVVSCRKGMWASGVLFPLQSGCFLAIEGVPLAAEETANPGKDMPKGIITAMVILLIFAGVVLVLAPGVAGSELMKDHGAPLVGALQVAYGENSSIATFVICGWFVWINGQFFLDYFCLL